MAKGAGGMDVKGMKPPLMANMVETLPAETRNARSWLGSHIDAQNTKEEPTRPDKIKIDAIDKKFTQSETVGLII